MRLLFVFLIAVIAADFLACTGEKNPYLDPNNSGISITAQSFENGGTVPIFSTQSLRIAPRLREHIAQISVRVDANRLWPQPDSIIPIDQFPDEPVTFTFSFYDTGWKEVTIAALRTDSGAAPFTLRVYAQSPLHQDAISPRAGDSIILSTPPVADRARYAWVLSNGIAITSDTNQARCLITGDLPSGTGELFVSDSVYRSSSAIFQITPVIVNYSLHVLIEPPQSGTIVATVNGQLDPGPYPNGTEVVLEAKPANGYEFGSWIGSIMPTSVAAVARVRMDSEVNLTVSFVIAAPIITGQPSSIDVMEGSPARFTIAATGLSLRYQWQRNDANIAGATANSFSITAAQLAQNGNRYRCVVSNSAGSIASEEAVLTVTARPVAPAIIRNPISHAVAENDSAMFSVVASGTPPLSYQWRANGVIIPGETGDTYTIAVVKRTLNNKRYSCVVSNSVGAVTSAEAVLTVLR